jgi:hypothetical protein
MVKFVFHLAVCVIAALMVVGCNESTFIGSDLLDDEAVNVKFVDTISPATKTIGSLALDANGNGNTYVVGELDDPVFGRSEADVYFAFDRVTSINTNVSTLDSVVIAIEYDTSGFYAEWEDASFDVFLHVGLEELPVIGIDTFSSSRSISVNPVPVTSILGRSINPYDSITIYDPGQDSLILQPTHFRMKLENAIAQEMFHALSSIETDAEFDAIYPSFQLNVVPNQSALIAFDIGNSTRSAGINGLKFYYTIDSSGVKREYEYLFDRGLSTVRHDVSGAPVEEYINNAQRGGELLYVQGLAGVRTSVDISKLRSIESGLINKVELEFTIAEGPEFFTDTYEPLVTYAASVLQNGEYVAIQDLGLSQSNPFIFDGIQDTFSNANGELLKKVTFNITNQVRNYLEDDSVSSEIIISSFTELEDPRRTIFYGPKSVVYPLKLNVAYTVSQ